MHHAKGILGTATRGSGEHYKHIVCSLQLQSFGKRFGGEELWETKLYETRQNKN
jgi:hypothetical protein